MRVEKLAPSFVYYVAGIAAGAAVNLITAIPTGNLTSADAAAIGWCSLPWLVASWTLTLMAESIDKGRSACERLATSSLTEQEVIAVEDKVFAPRRSRIWAYAILSAALICIGTFAALNMSAKRVNADVGGQSTVNTRLKKESGGSAAGSRNESGGESKDGAEEHVVVIVHGTKGSPEGNWFPWLAEQLREKGVKVIVPQFPTPEGQSLDEWRKVFKREVGELTPKTTLVGHSLGAGFILKLLSESDVPVNDTFLVSGFLGSLGLDDFDQLNRTFVTGTFEWERIRENAGKARVYNSDNDPYVPLEKGKELAQHLGVELTIVSNGGHINKEAGFDKFPLLLQEVIASLSLRSTNSSSDNETVRGVLRTGVDEQED